MMSIQHVELGKMCKVSAGQSAPQGEKYFGKVGNPFIRAGSLDMLVNGGAIDQCEWISDEIASKFGMQLFPENTIVFAKSGMSAKIGRIYRLKRPCYVVSHLATLQTSREIDPQYLYHWLVLNPPSFLIPNESYPSIRLADICSVKIPLFPLPEQKRIAEILNKADALCDKRKKSIAKLDELLQSVFLDMFGDPITNPKGWDIVELKDLLDFITSGSRGWAKYYSDIGDTFIRIQNLQNGQLNLNEIAFVNPPKSAEAKRTKVQSGDVLVSITADLGRVGVVPQSIGDAYVNQHIAILRVKEIQPSFLAFYLASSGGKAQFNRLNRQGVKAGLNFDDLRKLKILIPPMSLQNEFVQFREKLMQKSKKLLDSKVSIEMLFSSLQQRAFRGEI